MAAERTEFSGDTHASPEPSLVLKKCAFGLMLRWTGPQLLNLVLDCQLAPLEKRDLEIVHGRMMQRLINFPFNIPVLPLQFFKVVGKRHDWLLPSSGFLERTAHSRFPPLDRTVTVR